MRGTPATAAIACLCAWAGCSFGSPSVPDTGDDAPPVDAPPDAPAGAACLTDATYVENGGHRYKVPAESVDYDGAIDRCAADGAHLAIPETSAENDYMQGLANGTQLWIGVDDLTEEDVFRWVNGMPATFTRWASGEPNDNTTEDCTYLRGDGTWNDTSCSETRRAVCECDPAYRPPPTPACRTATSGFVRRFGRRYFVRTTPQPFPQAKADCESIGAHLLVVSDVDENVAMDLLLAGATWLGYTDADMEGTFRWVNGAPSSYNRWPGGTVPQDDTMDCAVLQDLGAWGNIGCDDSYAYACECDPAPP